MLYQALLAGQGRQGACCCHTLQVSACDMPAFTVPDDMPSVVTTLNGADSLQCCTRMQHQNFFITILSIWAA